MYTKTLSPAQEVWRRFKQNAFALSGAFLIVIATLVAILGYLITPDSTPDANQMCLPLALKHPGFTIQGIYVKKTTMAPHQHWWGKMLYGQEAAYSFVPINTIKTIDNTNKIIIEEFTGLSSDGAHIVKEVEKQLVLDPTQPVKQKTFLLGTDRYGRDMLSRLLIGTRITLSVGLISVFISLLVGVGMGAMAGFFRGWVDTSIMWLINVVWSLPTLLLVIAITLALGKGFWQVFIAVGLTMWTDVARVVRGQIFSLREMEYVQAARAMGFNNARIIIRHILPNMAGPVIVIAAANFASAILLEAGLSFLGVGAQPPMPSWGVMIKENYGYIIMDAAYLAILPGVAIMLMVLAFNLVGNGLRDAFDTKETFNARG